MGWLWVDLRGLIYHGLVIRFGCHGLMCRGLIVVGWLSWVDLWLCPTGSGECPSVDSGRTGEQAAERGRK